MKVAVEQMRAFQTAVLVVFLQQILRRVLLRQILRRVFLRQILRRVFLQQGFHRKVPESQNSSLSRG